MLKYSLLFLTTPVLLLALNAPTNLAVQATSKTSVSLDWNDNSDDEIGFKIFRDGHLVALTTPNTTHFEDINLNQNTKYTYLVYATDYIEDELITDKTTYAVGENITVKFRYLNDDVTWFAIYPIDTPDEQSGEANWYKYEDVSRIGSTIWAGRQTPGMYEIRAFNNNNYKRASYAFKVEATPKTKKLILAQGGTGWLPSMAENMIARHNENMQLPFDGFAIVGNSYTNEVMRTDTVTYANVIEEVGGLAGLYQGRDMFLTVKVKFSGDFWNPDVWRKINDNFGVIAKVAKDLGFKGIIFDDEADDNATKKMINFKFPTEPEIDANLENYTPWEIKGSRYAHNITADDNAYRNPNFTFEKHIEQVISLYQNIMTSMVANYPDIDVLVYHGPDLAHDGTFRTYKHKGHRINNGHGSAKHNEFTGAIFTGLKRGLSGEASIHDMGEMYKYRTEEHFARGYQWRKYNMAKNSSNEGIDISYLWRIPVEDRVSWRDVVNIGHMVFNKPVKDSNYPEYNPANVTNINTMKSDISLALSNTDEYTIYYCHDQEWLKPGHNGRPYIGSQWENMVREAKQ